MTFLQSYKKTEPNDIPLSVYSQTEAIDLNYKQLAKTKNVAENVTLSVPVVFARESKKKGKDQELIQSSTTPGHHIEK